MNIFPNQDRIFCLRNSDGLGKKREICLQLLTINRFRQVFSALTLSLRVDLQLGSEARYFLDSSSKIGIHVIGT